MICGKFFAYIKTSEKIKRYFGCNKITRGFVSKHYIDKKPMIMYIIKRNGKSIYSSRNIDVRLMCLTIVILINTKYIMNNCYLQRL